MIHPEPTLTTLYAALATRWNKKLGQVKKILTDGQVVIEEWGRLQQIDSEAGDTMHSSGLGTI